ncbi:hypothetical protein Tco_0912137 [Tanacetum coccineum]
MVRLVKHGLEEFGFEVVRWIDDEFVEEVEKLGWWFEQDIGDEGGWMKRMEMIERRGRWILSGGRGGKGDKREFVVIGEVGGVLYGRGEGGDGARL